MAFRSEPNLWQMGPGSWKDNYPIGRDAEQFILENCQFLLYLRMDRRFKCPEHWDESSSSVKNIHQYCDVCKGFGFKTSAACVPSRVTYDAAHVSNRETELRLPPGYMEYFNAVVHFPRKIRPASEDVIAICEWSMPTQRLHSVPTARILKATSVMAIKQINDRFERELAFYSCGVELMPHLQSKLDLLVPHLTQVPVTHVQDTWKQNSFW